MTGSLAARTVEVALAVMASSQETISRQAEERVQLVLDGLGGVQSHGDSALVLGQHMLSAAVFVLANSAERRTLDSAFNVSSTLQPALTARSVLYSCCNVLMRACCVSVCIVTSMHPTVRASMQQLTRCTWLQTTSECASAVGGVSDIHGWVV